MVGPSVKLTINKARDRNQLEVDLVVRSVDPKMDDFRIDS